MSASTPQQLFESRLELALRIARSIPIIGYSVDEQEQEARIALWKAANAFDPSRGDFDPFASTVIRNHLLNVLKKAQRTAHFESTSLDVRATHEGEEESESLKETSIPSPDPSPLTEAERNDIRAALRDGISSLTPAQQEVLHSYAAGNSFAEIARQNGVSKAAVRQMVQRAADQVRPVIRSTGGFPFKALPSAGYEQHDTRPLKQPQRSLEDRLKNLVGVIFLIWLIYMLLRFFWEIHSL